MEKQNQNKHPNRPAEQAITAMLSGAIANRQCILNGNALVALHLDALTNSETALTPYHCEPPSDGRDHGVQVPALGGRTSTGGNRSWGR